MEQQQAPQDRPSFPAEAATWLAGSTPRTVVTFGSADLAAALEALGHDVAVLPSCPSRLPFLDRSVDAVVCAQALPRHLDDVARVLRAGGQLALVWLQRDHRIPWARKLDRALGNGDAPEAPAERLVTSTAFGFVDEYAHRYWQVVNRDSLADLVRREFAGSSPDVQERRVRAAIELYDDYGRGADGMQLPWVSRCFRATVVESAWSTPLSIDQTGELTLTEPIPEPEPVLDDGSTLLIDFR